MSVIQRGIVFAFITFSNAILFLFHSRVILEIVRVANEMGEGPATGAINLIPQAIMIGIAIIQVAAIAYFLGAFSEERTVTRRPAR